MNSRSYLPDGLPYFFLEICKVGNTSNLSYNAGKYGSRIRRTPLRIPPRRDRKKPTKRNNMINVLAYNILFSKSLSLSSSPTILGALSVPDFF